MKKSIYLLLVLSLTAHGSETYLEYVQRINSKKYIVQPGDTPKSILIKHGYKNINGLFGNLNHIIFKNALRKNGTLRIGSVVLLPYQEEVPINTLSLDAKEISLSPQRQVAADEKLSSEHSSEEALPAEMTAPAVDEPTPLEVPVDVSSTIEEKAKEEEKQTATALPEATPGEAPPGFEPVGLKRPEVPLEYNRFRLLFGTEMSKYNFEDPISGEAELNSGYHYSLEAFWYQKWGWKFYTFLKVGTEFLRLDPPVGISFSRTDFFLPNYEIGFEKFHGKNKYGLSILYDTQMQPRDRINQEINVGTLNQLSAQVEYERLLKQHGTLTLTGFGIGKYLIPLDSKGVQIQSGYGATLGAKLVHKGKTWSIEAIPYIRWQQRATDLTNETQTGFGLKMGVKKPF